jgi:hypothetical protein
LKTGNAQRDGKGRSVKPGQGAFELRETQSAYSSIFHLENSDMAPKLGLFYLLFLLIPVG